VRYSQPITKFVIVFAIVLTIGLIVRSFSDPDSLKGLWASVLFIILPMLTLQSATYIFDQKKRMFSYQVRGPAFRKRNGQVAFDQIREIEMERHVDSDGDGYRIVLRCDGQTLALNDSFEAKEKILDCFKQVHETVLNRTPALEAYSNDRKSSIRAIPPRSSGQLTDSVKSSVRTLIGEKKMIEAIKLVRQEAGVGLKEAKAIVDKMKSEDL
jgi:hypothetical protein